LSSEKDKNKLKTLMCIIFVLLLSGAAIAADCMRCVSHDINSFSQDILLCKGDTISNTIVKCGEPNERERCGSIKVKRPSGNNGSYIVVREPLEKVRYNCGDGQFKKELLFQGGYLKSIKNLSERGSGTPVCW
jgi:hypothetical protein